MRNKMFRAGGTRMISSGLQIIERTFKRVERVEFDATKTCERGQENDSQ